MKLNIGIIGAGGFARFAIREFLKIPGVNLKGVYDIKKENSEYFTSKYNCNLYNTLDHILKDSEINLVYIATPPWLHYAHSKEALQNNKHVICEKPVSIKLEHAKELIQIANDKRRLFVVNLMQPYNPLVQNVKKIIKAKILGGFLHGYFENYASDESLNEDHWLWDESISGGIFIEHAVHFFDLFSHWLGTGKVVNAIELKRKNYEEHIADRVQASVQYEEGTVNFYHGFDQPRVFDRQEFKLIFERGDITLNEWVPTTMKINALVSKSELEQLKEIVKPEKIKIIGSFTKNKNFKARFKSFTADFHVSMISGINNKEEIYKSILKLFMEDQVKWLSDNNHTRIVTAQNAISSLEMAIDAHKMAI